MPDKPVKISAYVDAARLKPVTVSDLPELRQQPERLPYSPKYAPTVSACREESQIRTS
jgi:hypothetical protein